MKSVSQSRGGDELQPLPSSMVAWNDAEQVGRSAVQNAMLEASGGGAMAHCKTPAEKVNTKTCCAGRCPSCLDLTQMHIEERVPSVASRSFCHSRVNQARLFFFIPNGSKGERCSISDGSLPMASLSVS